MRISDPFAKGNLSPSQQKGSVITSSTAPSAGFTPERFSLTASVSGHVTSRSLTPPAVRRFCATCALCRLLLAQHLVRAGAGIPGAPRPRDGDCLRRWATETTSMTSYSKVCGLLNCPLLRLCSALTFPSSWKGVSMCC